ncbi:MAG TPA: hypothetical protein ENK63_05230 [Rhodobacterales bacterium]|nr:hypothetical protein [Rhodobacterales bacterium]
MRVTDIGITDLHFSQNATGQESPGQESPGHERPGHEGPGHEGYVSMALQPQRAGAPPLHLQFFCRADQPENCPSTIVMRDLIKDALRQARRMPGFRRGEHAFEVDVNGASISPRSANA